MATAVPLQDKPAPHLSAHLVAPAKYGKTSALATLPKPMLLVSIDGSHESLFIDEIVPPEKRQGIYIYEPKFGGRPTYQEVFDAVTVEWMKGPDGKPYASLALDNMSYLMENVVKAEILGKREKMELQDWGLYLIRGLTIAKKAHEIAMSEDGCHTVITFWEADKTKDEDQVGKLGPAVQGQLFDILPGIPNYALFLRVLRVMNKGKLELERKLQTEADNRTPAGSRRKLNTYEPPDFEALWNKVKPKVQP